MSTLQASRLCRTEPVGLVYIGRFGMINGMLIAELVTTWSKVAATSSRLAKIQLLADCMRHLSGAEIVPGVAYLTGELRQRQIGVGWAAMRDLPEPAAGPSVTVAELDTALERIGGLAGKGSQAARRDALAELFGRATADEQRFLRQLLVGELRQGAQAGVMADAVARAADVPVAAVRRALLVGGDLRLVAATALTEGAAGLAGFSLQVGRPLAPMLAQTADSIEAAMDKVAPAAVEWKLDGIRVQVHRDGSDIAVFTRSLDDITARVPEVVAAVAALPARTLVIDGEAIALRKNGRPERFQVTASRVGAKGDPESLRGQIPVTPMFFDVLHLDGTDQLDLPEEQRFAALAGALPDELLIPRIVADDVAAAREFFAQAIERGHEGVVCKALDAPYDAGRRGGGWLKVKPRHTLDLVILAAEWGHGRRSGRLSNLHLGARDPDSGGFVMLGKTFKGLTDQMLAWQTVHLLELATEQNDWVVHVRPELVCEIAFDGVQRSRRYPGGLALRFARVKGYRMDKTAAEADTIDTVREIYDRQAE
jgi:DNA ligase-1